MKYDNDDLGEAIVTVMIVIGIVIITIIILIIK